MIHPTLMMTAPATKPIARPALPQKPIGGGDSVSADGEPEGAAAPNATNDTTAVSATTTRRIIALFGIP